MTTGLTKKPNFIRRLPKLLWKTLTFVRVALSNLIFFAILFIIFGALIENAPKPITDSAPLLIAPSGLLVDQLSYQSPSDELLNFNNNQPSETLTYELIETITHAAQNEKITGLILQLDYLVGGGISKMSEVGAAIEQFKDTGKPVVAYADSYSQQQYFLASFANEIHLNDMGAVILNGYGLYRNYYKDALNKLAINFHVFKVGKFKDFVEPYIRDSMSRDSKEHNALWLNELWHQYTQVVEKQRGLKPGSIDHYVHNANNNLRSHDADTAKLAQASKLVDHINSRIKRNTQLIESFGQAKNNETMFKHITYNRYRQSAFPPQPQKNGNIGLIIARGRILDGNQPEGQIGGDSLAKLLQKARKDDDLEALIIRVDSGGGSAFASEIIRQEIIAVKNSGKSVFISMGSVAASGGYWLSAPADEIWATPTTITGSIGVFGLFPTVDKTLKKLGVNNDGIATTSFGGGLSLSRPLNPELGELLQQGVEGTYNKFITLVAQSRDMTTSEIHEMAQGRVWSGTKAKTLGLVDQLGGLPQVIIACAKHAKISDPTIKLIERELSPQEHIIKMLSTTIANATSQDSVLRSQTHNLKQFISLFSHTLNELEPVLDARPLPINAQCLMCIAP